MKKLEWLRDPSSFLQYRWFGLRGKYETESYWNWFWDHVTWCLGRREITFFWQRHTRGFDDSELWSVDDTIIRFTLPRLKAFRNLRNGEGPMGFPAGIVEEWGLGEIDNSNGWAEYDQDATDKGYAKWLEIIDKMIQAMEIYVREDGYPFEDEDRAKYEEGMDLFHIYFNSLWD